MSTKINYKAFDVTKLKPEGSESVKKKKGEMNLNDGLNKKEIDFIDKNKDGTITEQEFKEAYGGEDSAYKKSWEALQSAYKAKVKEDKESGRTVKSKYDKDGNMTGYTVTKTNDEDGTVTQTTYDMKDGKAVKQKEKTTTADGTTTTTTQKGKYTTKTAHGTSATKNKDGKITSVKGEDNDKVSFSYDKDGNVTGAKVKIGGKKYSGKNVTYSKDKSTTYVKDKNGKIVAKIHNNANGNSYITAYKDGKKSKVYKVDSTGKPLTEKTYNSKGKLEKTKFCASGVERTFKYDKDGKLESSVDKDENGKKLSEQTYLKDSASKYYAGKKGHLYATKTYYDENGNPRKYQEFSYKSNSKKTDVTKTVKSYTYENGKKVLSKTAEFSQDEYGNTKKAKITNADGTISTKTYTYDTKRDKYLGKKHYKTVTEDSGNKRITRDYKDGVVSHKKVVTVNNGQSTTTETDYTYYPDSNNTRKTKTVTTSSGKKIEYKYNLDGSYSKTYTDSKGNKITKYYDTEGQEITPKENE